MDKEPQDTTSLIVAEPTTKKGEEKPQLKICPMNLEQFYPPRKGTEKATCYNVYLPTDVMVPRGLQNPTQIALGFKMEIPKGYDIRLHLRSSVGRDYHLIMANSVGIVDEDFRGELMAYVYNLGNYPIFLKEGQRVFQIELYQKDNYEIEVVSSISEDTERGHESGSTGR